MPNTFSRRQFVGLGMGGLATAALAGCSSTGKGSAAGSSSLAVSWYGGAPVDTAMKKVLALYGAKQSGLKISAQHAAFADYWDKLATETAARNEPDVMRMSMSHFSEYADRGALLDLSKYVGKQIDISNMSPGVANSGKLAGKRYGIGQNQIANAAFINPEMISSLGVEKPNGDWTWDSFANWARSVHTAGGAKVYGTPDLGGHLEVFIVYGRQNGSEPFDGKTLAVSQDLIQQWWEYWAMMRRDNGAPPASVTAGVTGFNTSTIVRGLTPIEFGWVQQLSAIQPLMKQQLNIITPPVVAGGKPGLYVNSQDVWCIASTTKSPDKAAGLIDFMTNDPQAIKALGVSLGAPPTKKGAKVLALKPDSNGGKAIAYVEALSASNKASAPPAPWPVGYSQLTTAFTKIAQDIAFGKSTPAKGAADFYSQAKQSLGK